MRFAVVGAGLSGLAAAGRLAQAGHRVTVFEKSRGLGGRMATRRVEGAVLDHGCPSLRLPAGSALGALVHRLPGEERVALADGKTAFRPGMTWLAKRMADSLDVRTGVRLATLRATATGGLELGDDQGNPHGRADGVVVSAPAPQAADLLEQSPEPAGRVAAVRSLAYRPALVALLGLRLDVAPPWPVAWPDDGPVMSVACEGAKGRPAAGGVAAVVVRLGHEASRELFDAPEEDVLAATRPALTALLGPPAARPAWSQMKRWRLAEPEGRLDPDALNPPGARVVLTGDAFCGPDLAAVYDEGLAAAARVMALTPPTSTPRAVTVARVRGGFTGSRSAA